MKTKILTILLEPSVYEAIRRAAYEAHCSMGEIARRAVAGYLSKREGIGKSSGKRRGS